MNVSQPSDVPTARAAAAGAFNSHFLGFGVVALIVGAVGVALGATAGQIGTQVDAESILLTVLGGIVGVLAGAAVTTVAPTRRTGLS